MYNFPRFYRTVWPQEPCQKTVGPRRTNEKPAIYLPKAIWRCFSSSLGCIFVFLFSNPLAVRLHSSRCNPLGRPCRARLQNYRLSPDYWLPDQYGHDATSMSETLGRILGHARKYSFRKAERRFRDAVGVSCCWHRKSVYVWRYVFVLVFQLRIWNF